MPVLLNNTRDHHLWNTFMPGMAACQFSDKLPNVCFSLQALLHAEDWGGHGSSRRSQDAHSQLSANAGLCQDALETEGSHTTVLVDKPNPPAAQGVGPVKLHRTYHMTSKGLTSGGERYDCPGTSEQPCQ